MRGQAFVSFADVENAKKARKEVNEFPLYGKPMVGVNGPLWLYLKVYMSNQLTLQLISFAKQRADVAVSKFEGAEALENQKKERLVERSMFDGLLLTWTTLMSRKEAT